LARSQSCECCIQACNIGVNVSLIPSVLCSKSKEIFCLLLCGSDLLCCEDLKALMLQLT
jgi:hypothetical protein